LDIPLPFALRKRTGTRKNMVSGENNKKYKFNMVPNHHNYDGIDSSHVEKDHDSDQIQHGLDQFH